MTRAWHLIVRVLFFILAIEPSFLPQGGPESHFLSFSPSSAPVPIAALGDGELLGGGRGGKAWEGHSGQCSKTLPAANENVDLRRGRIKMGSVVGGLLEYSRRDQGLKNGRAHFSGIGAGEDTPS